MYLIIFLLLTLCSCGGHLKLSNAGCESSQAIIGKGDEPVLFNESFWHKSMGEHENTIFVKELLNKNKIDCTKVNQLSYELGQGLIDSFLSLIPFVRRTNVIVKGNI